MNMKERKEQTKDYLPSKNSRNSKVRGANRKSDTNETAKLRKVKQSKRKKKKKKFVPNTTTERLKTTFHVENS